MRFLPFSIVFGVCLGIAPEFLPRKQPQILQVDEFWRVNGTYVNDGEVYEVFYPPLPKMLDNTTR